MKKLRVYVDSSVIGGCLDHEFEKWSNGLFRDFHVGTFLPVLSDIVDAEMRNAPPEVLEKHAELLGLEPERIKLSDEAIDLAGVYIQENIISQNYRDDALHIALATIAHVDILVSWNFKHIVNYGKIRQFNGVNIRQGYNTIQIYSPREVTSYGD